MTNYPAILFALLTSAATLAAPDFASIKIEPSSWTLSNNRIQRKITLTNGKLLTTSLQDLTTKHELIPPSHPSEEISSPGWSLVSSQDIPLPHDAHQLNIVLLRNNLYLTKSYIIYPSSTLIRQWTTFANIGPTPFPIDEPDFLQITPAISPTPASQDFLWMTGGENNPGSWTLRTEHLNPSKPRTFDSYSPFPSPTGAVTFPGDGIDARIQLNDKQIWPATGKWQYIPNAATTLPIDLTTTVVAGDHLIFRVNMHGNIGWDTTSFDPTISYPDGESHTASKEFSGTQGKNNWRYQYIESEKFVDLRFYPQHQQWRKQSDNATGTPFIAQNDQHPDVNQDSVRVWTAPKGGQVHLTASISNSGNRSSAASPAGFKPGTANFAPWYSLYDHTTHQGLFIGFDYFGHWSSSFLSNPDGTTTINLRVAGHHQILSPGQTLTTPQSFLGLYHDDLDNAGNELLDWQYAYDWDNTRDGSNNTFPWFPALRTLGFWSKGTGWGQPGVGWLGGNPDLLSTFRKVFRVADYMRYTGVDVYHRDWGWWDLAGDWNGPDFRATNTYLHKSNMGELIYAFLYTVSHDSKVGRTHPDWLIGDTLDMSNPAVVDFMESQLDSFVQRWGDFEWRNDSFFTAPKNGDDTPLLAQDQGFRQLLQRFLTKHPASAFQAVNGGGNYGGYNYISFASTFSFSDGAVGPLRNYYASLLFPPDKTSDIPDIYNPDQYDKSTWRGLLCLNYDTTGDTINPEKLEGIRQLNDIYHYLLHQGVVGRYVHVYRPTVTGDDPTMYFQRLSQDSKRGIIIPKHTAPSQITLHPKGLLPTESYQVTFQESDASETHTGADLMSTGITLQKMPPGELIYLNLPLHPGSKLDHTPPTPPTNLHTQPAENMGFPGLELTWSPATDDNWVSHYEIFRDDKPIDKVAKGTYYFDHSAGADPAAHYQIRTLDGAQNPSPLVSPVASDRSPLAPPRSQILDDPQFTYTGLWQHQTSLQPTHNHTLSLSSQKGATAQIHFKGNHLLLFTTLSPDGGLASISIDNSPPETIDTYDADDLYGIPIYQKTLPQNKDHTLLLTVLGQKNPHSTNTTLHLDALRAEHN